MSDSSELEQASRLNRREAIRRLSLLLGGAAFIGGGELLAAAERVTAPIAGTPGDFSAADIQFLDEIAETILPATKTPGAKAAKVGAFMALMVTDSYSHDQQQVFRAGLHKMDEASIATHQVPFMAASPAQRLELLTALDREQKAALDAQSENPESPVHYFHMMKQLALLGYFTSEIGCTQAQRYVEVPGRFDPCVPYTPGEGAWASHA